MIHRQTACLFGLAIVVSIVAVEAQEEVTKFRSAAARSAQKKYKEAMDKARTHYERAVRTAQRDYVRRLEAARKAALRRGDFEEAMTIARVKKNLERETRRISGGPGQEERSKLVIIKATWGARGKTVDVTDRLRSMIRDNKLSIAVVGHKIADRDPFFGVVKDLSVEYMLGSERYTVVCKEGEVLVLPTGEERAGNRPGITSPSRTKQQDVADKNEDSEPLGFFLTDSIFVLMRGTVSAKPGKTFLCVVMSTDSEQCFQATSTEKIVDPEHFTLTLPDRTEVKGMFIASWSPTEGKAKARFMPRFRARLVAPGAKILPDGKFVVVWEVAKKACRLPFSVRVGGGAPKPVPDRQY